MIFSTLTEGDAEVLFPHGLSCYRITQCCKKGLHFNKPVHNKCYLYIFLDVPSAKFFICKLFPWFGYDKIIEVLSFKE